MRKRTGLQAGGLMAIVGVVAAVALLLGTWVFSGNVFASLPASNGSNSGALSTNGHDGSGQVTTYPNGVTAGQALHSDTSAPLRNLPPQPMKRTQEHEASANPLDGVITKDGVDTAIQSTFGKAPAAMPTPILSFDGVNFPGVGCNCAPPDTDGEVGLTQYVQMVNEGLQVFNKTTGASLFGPVGITTLWTGFGGVCQNNGDGDPIVLYDQLADRWLVSQFAGSGVPTDECIAISQTGDATGSYYRYDFHLGTNFYDYPHLGMWPDGYYMADNVFNSAGTARLGPQPFVFDRAAMLAGSPTAGYQTTGILSSSTTYFLPSDLEGSISPPAGAPNFFIGAPSGTTMPLYRFHTDWATPANTTFTNNANLTVPAYTQLCPSTRACVPEPGVAANLDGIGDRPMFRATYRRFTNGTESLLSNQSVLANSVAGVRWYEVQNLSTTPTLAQASTYQPDTTWRWLGSITQDQFGDIGLAYSASSSAVFPSLYYTGRIPSDPINTMGQGEAVLYAGTGVQGSGLQRWGDYSDLTVDPTDDCTFYYTNEYLPAGTGTFNWHTRIGSFRFGSCAGVPNTDTPTVTGTPPTATNTRTATATASPTTCSNFYTVVTTTGTIISGTVDVGNHVDDGTTTFALPFSVSLYGQSYNSATVGSNGTLSFGTSDNSFTNTCLPDPAQTYQINPYYDDQCTAACNAGTVLCTGCGIFTTTVGTNFYIEWRTNLYNGGTPENYEVVLTQGSSNFSIIYGPGTTDSASETIGVQKDSTSTFTSYKCNTASPAISAGLQLNFNYTLCSTTTGTPSATAAASTTSTSVSTSTDTAVASSTSTTQPVASSTSTTQPVASATGTTAPAASATSTVAPTACPIQFADVPASGNGSTFYVYARCLVCRGIVSGYPCGGVGEPCNANSDPYYRPGANVTRGQLSKIISNAAGLSNAVPGSQRTYSDVPSTDPFWIYIERLSGTGAISGYACGTTNPQTGAALPCDSANRPYFLTTNNATRGQISKIVSIAAGFTEAVSGQTFSDVPATSPFYQYIQRLSNRHIIDGYDAASGKCAAHEPAYAPPCFLYNDFTTRGQMAKIAANAFFPNCQTASPEAVIK